MSPWSLLGVKPTSRDTVQRARKDRQVDDEVRVGADGRARHLPNQAPPPPEPPPPTPLARTFATIKADPSKSNVLIARGIGVEKDAVRRAREHAQVDAKVGGEAGKHDNGGAA